jgi:hypothetical protein
LYLRRRRKRGRGGTKAVMEGKKDKIHRGTQGRGRPRCGEVITVDMRLHNKQSKELFPVDIEASWCFARI